MKIVIYIADLHVIDLFCIFLLFDVHNMGITLVLLPEPVPGRERLITEQYVVTITHRCVFK